MTRIYCFVFVFRNRCQNTHHRSQLSLSSNNICRSNWSYTRMRLDCWWLMTHEANAIIATFLFFLRNNNFWFLLGIEANTGAALLRLQQTTQTISQRESFGVATGGIEVKIVWRQPVLFIFIGALFLFVPSDRLLKVLRDWEHQLHYTTPKAKIQESGKEINIWKSSITARGQKSSRKGHLV